jgi:hypothetical protein
MGYSFKMMLSFEIFHCGTKFSALSSGKWIALLELCEGESVTLLASIVHPCYRRLINFAKGGRNDS